MWVDRIEFRMKRCRRREEEDDDEEEEEEEKEEEENLEITFFVSFLLLTIVFQ